MCFLSDYALSFAPLYARAKEKKGQFSHFSTVEKQENQENKKNKKVDGGLRSLGTGSLRLLYPAPRRRFLPEGWTEFVSLQRAPLLLQGTVRPPGTTVGANPGRSMPQTAITWHTHRFRAADTAFVPEVRRALPQTQIPCRGHRFRGRPARAPAARRLIFAPKARRSGGSRFL